MTSNLIPHLPGKYTLIESTRAKRRRSAPITLTAISRAADCSDVKGDHLDGWFKIQYTNDASGPGAVTRTWMVQADQLVPR